MGDGLSLQVNNTMKSGKIRNAAPDKAEARDLEAGKFGTAVPDLSALCARLEQRLNSANDAGLGKSSSAANDEKVEMETKEESTKATSGEADSKSPSQSATETIMKAVNSNLVIDFKLMAKINNFNLELDLVGMQKKMFQPDPDPEKPKYKISALDWSRVGETLHKHSKHESQNRVSGT